MKNMLTISSRDELISFILHVLGFHPESSTICMAIGGGPSSRMNLPQTPEEMRHLLVGTERWCWASSRSPAKRANAITRTSPADYTRFGSSNTAEVAADVWQGCIYEVALVHTLVRRYLPGWQIRAGGIEMFRANAFAIERYRYRGAKIPRHGRTRRQQDHPHQRHEHVESRMR